MALSRSLDNVIIGLDPDELSTKKNGVEHVYLIKCAYKRTRLSKKEQKNFNNEIWDTALDTFCRQ